MVFWKKAFAFVVASLLFFVTPVTMYAEGELVPEVEGEFAVSIDARTGDVLYDKNAYAHAYPASMTKVLTAILLMEHTEKGEQIAFSQTALDQVKSNYQIELQVGETVDRDTALMILMVLSANDVAYAIGEHVGGTAENFAAMMNAKAKQLGAKDSNFVTSSGLHDLNHYTTAYDMAMITRGVLPYPEILTAMNTKETTVTTSLQTASIFNKGRYFENPYCIGGKTGFTDEARNTLVQLNEKDGNRIINVVMASHRPAIYEDMKKLADFAFPQFTKQMVLDKNSWNEEATYLEEQVDGELEKSIELVMKQNEGKNVKAVFKQSEIDKKSLYETGIHRGDVIGTVDVMKNNETLESVNVLSTEDIAFESPEKASDSVVKNHSWKLVAGIGAGVIIVTIVGIYVGKRRRTNGIAKKEKQIS
ncbi:D-alanyl-D-alanine carboxypeptidase family protein [Bacillus manliponensis]|uniref:D-alanyl-D-alanine carboxypeptidase family protein n=1 Tax=Bacillus manliponensis TaxID=574376 RepID=UPI00351450AA